MLKQSHEKAGIQQAGQTGNAMSPHRAASGGLMQMFALQPKAAVLTVLVDAMVFSLDTASLEVLLPLGIAVAAVLGFIVYKIQRKEGGDDRDTALIKGVTIALLTAIPVPLSPFIAIPGGLIGIVKAITRK
jgi:chromate transport protein ChrA